VHNFGWPAFRRTHNSYQFCGRREADQPVKEISRSLARIWDTGAESQPNIPSGH
jgi:hypothetical protein